MSGVMSYFFDNAVGLWRETAEKTARVLAADDLRVFIDLSNDAIDIRGAILDAYPPDDFLHSLVIFDFHALDQQLWGMAFDFLCGRYAEVGRGLRFAWESIFRAFYADCYQAIHPGAANPPGPELNDKAAWLEARRPNWATVMVPVLQYLFPAWPAVEVTQLYKPIWDRLNAAAHPSDGWRSDGVRESARHVWFNFDEGLARQLAADACQVFDGVWVAVVKRFPKAAPALARRPNAFRACPRVRQTLPA